ncbi:hypothetical protein [Methanoplanus endosymbiosus]|uniref:Uncharacterized protein n=1 Tax=Methanoplanus endosymbiosus TaxID=33865 RepID=A0A9E7TGI5_9EURY|nr:hypothetical protein [Methanoplanus endosymbiosus]UUX91212.1 hypothetical protein L6E24_07415 [Methanoplanus endosymbiosus]
MKEKPLKAADIAKISGLSEKEIKSVTEEYHEIVPCRKFGRVNLYEENAVSKITEIVRMKNEGKSRDEIYADSGRRPDKKSTHERVREKVRKESSGLPGKTRQPGKTAIIPDSSSVARTGKKESSERLKELAESRKNREDINNVDNIAAQALKTDRAIVRIEKLESEITSLKERIESDREIIRSHFEDIEKKLNIMSEWMEFFDGEREKIRDGIEESHLNRNYELDAIREGIEKSRLSHEDDIAKIKDEIEILKLPWLKRRKYL